MRPVNLPPAVRSEAVLVCLPSPESAAMFRYILEADGHGLAMATMLDPRRGLVKLMCSPHQRRELVEFLEANCGALGLRWRGLPPAGASVPWRGASASAAQEEEK